MKKNMKRKKRTLFLCMIVSALFLSACGSAKASRTTSMTISETAAAMSSNMAMDSAAETELEEAGSGSAINSSAALDQSADTNRKLIRTVNLDVETDDFDTLLKTLQEQIIKIAGYVEQSDISGNSMQNDRSRRRAYMTVRIPSTSLDQFIVSVEENGNVTNKTETTKDVTLQYTDLESKKKTLTTEQERIFALLEKADSLESIIALEERLSEIRYELESMESKLRLYDNQVEYSTVYVNIEEVKIYTPTAPLSIGERIKTGFTQNVETMKDTTINFVVWFLSSIPVLLPLLAVLVCIGWLIRRKAAKKKIKSVLSGIASISENDTENK